MSEPAAEQIRRWTASLQQVAREMGQVSFEADKRKLEIDAAWAALKDVIGKPPEQDKLADAIYHLADQRDEAQHQLLQAKLVIENWKRRV